MGAVAIAGPYDRLSFYFERAVALTSEERLFAVRVAVSRLRRSVSFAFPTLLEEDSAVRHEFVTIDFSPVVRGVLRDSVG